MTSHPAWAGRPDSIYHGALTDIGSAPSADRRFDIEGLRAVAVAAVLLFHFFPAWCPGGFIGVDVFFVISGYVVTLSVARRMREGRFRFADFYERRVRRLFPALALVSLVSLVTAWALLFQKEYSSAGLETLLTSLFSVNFKLARQSGYFDTAAAASPNLHYWSLAVEEQFYLVWPLFLVLTVGALLPRRVGVVTLTIAGSFILNLVVTPRWPDFAFYMLPTRGWEFAAGGAMAIFWSRMRISRPVWREAFPVAGLSLIAGASLLLGSDTTFPAWQALFPVVGTVLIIVAHDSRTSATVLASRPMVWTGRRSYPIYLWHWLPIVFYRQWFFADPGLGTALIMMAAVIIAADLTYRYVERPFRSAGAGDAGARLPSRIAVPALVAASIGVGTAGFLAWRGYVPERLSSSREVLTARTDQAPADQHLVLPGTTGRTLLLFGDSYIEEYIPAFQRIAEARAAGTMTVEVFTRGGCAPVPLLNRRSEPYCLDFARQGFEMASRANVEHVLIGGSWLGFLGRGDYYDPATGRTVNPGADSGSAVWHAFEDQVAKLVAAGKEVYLVLNPPGGRQADPVWIARHFSRGVQMIPLAEHERRVARVNLLLTGIAGRAGATALNPQDWLCNAEGCPVTTPDGMPIFADPTHLRASYVRANIRALDHLAESHDDAMIGPPIRQRRP